MSIWKGLKARSCNSYICAINSYLNWTGSAFRVPKLKDEQIQQVRTWIQNGAKQD